MATITIRDLDPGEKSWLQNEAGRAGVSMEEFVRRLIRESHRKAISRERPSEAFRRYFGPEHGIELPERRRYGYRTVSFDNDGQR